MSIEGINLKPSNYVKSTIFLMAARRKALAVTSELWLIRYHAISLSLSENLRLCDL